MYINSIETLIFHTEIEFNRDYFLRFCTKYDTCTRFSKYRIEFKVALSSTNATIIGNSNLKSLLSLYNIPSLVICRIGLVSYVSEQDIWLLDLLCSGIIYSLEYLMFNIAFKYLMCDIALILFQMFGGNCCPHNLGSYVPIFYVCISNLVF